MTVRLKIRFLRLFAHHRVLLNVETVLVWLIFVAAIFYGISFFVIPAAAEAKLHKLCGGAVDIQSGRFKGISAIRLAGVIIAEDDRAILDAPILQADKIEVQFDFWQLLKGQFVAHSVTLSDFLLSADYDLSSKKWNLGGLSLQKTTIPSQHIPLLKIQRGAVRVRQETAEQADILATISVNGQIAVPINKNEYSFMLETDGRFGFGQSKLQGSFQIGEDEEKSQLFANGYITMPAAGILQNRWDLQNIKLEAAFDDETVTIKQFEFLMGQGKGEIDGVIHRTDNHEIDLNIGLHGLTLSDRYIRGTVSYGWLIDSSDSGFARFLNRFHPAGAGELDLSIKGNLKDLSQTQLNGLILCKDISIRDENFPYQIGRMQGEIEFKDRTIHLKEIQARHEDVHLQLDGQVTNDGPQTSIDFRVTSPDMRFDKDLYHSLSEKVKKAWYDFTPEGLTEVDYHYWKTPDGEEGKELVLELKDASATYKYFPYPLKNLTGRIVLRPQQLIMNDVLASYAHGGQIKVFGRVLQQEEIKSVFDVHIQGEDIPVDPQLIKALPEKYEPFFNHLQIDERAAADFDVTVFPNKTDKRFLAYSAGIEATADTFRHDTFPLSMTDVKLKATVTEDSVRLDSFGAQTDSGPIRIDEGQLWSQGAEPNQPGICLALDLKGFDLNKTFWDALGPEARKKLGKLDIRGPVDAKGLLVVNVPKTAEGANDLLIDCHDNPLTWDDSVLGRADGRLHIQDGDVLFSEFQLADISLESIPKELMSEKVARVLTQVNPKGTVDLYLNKGSLKTGPQGAERIDVHARINAEDLSFGQTNSVSGLDGDCQGDFVFDFETRQWQAQARYDVGQFIYRNQLVTDLSGDVSFDPNSMQWQSDGFTSTFCDGNVIGNLRLHVKPNQVPRYQLELNYDHVDTKLLLAAETQIEPQQVAQGLASGRLALEGDIDDISTSRGTFKSTTVNLKMGQQSLLGKILTAVQLKQPENFVFNQIDVDAAVLGPELIFEDIRMLGTPLIFHGTGRLNLQNRQIEMELASWDRKNANEETVLETLTLGIGSALWKVEVRGTLDTPEVDANYLGLFKQPLDIFKDKE